MMSGLIGYLVYSRTFVLPFCTYHGDKYAYINTPKSYPEAKRGGADGACDSRVRVGVTTRTEQS